MVGRSLPKLGAGRVITATAPSTPIADGERVRACPLAADRDDADGDPTSSTTIECTDDQHDLVVRAELFDRPVLERLGDPVDEHLADRDDRRRRTLDETDDHLGRRQPRSGGDETERDAIAEPGVGPRRSLDGAWNRWHPTRPHRTRVET